MKSFKLYRTKCKEVKEGNCIILCMILVRFLIILHFQACKTLSCCGKELLQDQLCNLKQKRIGLEKP